MPRSFIKIPNFFIRPSPNSSILSILHSRSTLSIIFSKPVLQLKLLSLFVPCVFSIIFSKSRLQSPPFTLSVPCVAPSVTTIHSVGSLRRVAPSVATIHCVGSVRRAFSHHHSLRRFLASVPCIKLHHSSSGCAQVDSQGDNTCTQFGKA